MKLEKKVSNLLANKRVSPRKAKLVVLKVSPKKKRSLGLKITKASFQVTFLFAAIGFKLLSLIKV